MFWVLSIVVFSICYKGKLHEWFKAKIEDFKDLNTLVQTTKKSNIKAFLISCKMIGQLFWVNILHTLNNTMEYPDKHHFILTYVADGRLYKMASARRKGPPLVLMVLDEQGDDVSNDVIPFLGPERNWHRNSFSPAFWKKKKLIFELSDGRSESFNETEAIIL